MRTSGATGAPDIWEQQITATPALCSANTYIHCDGLNIPAAPAPGATQRDWRRHNQGLATDLLEKVSLLPVKHLRQEMDTWLTEEIEPPPDPPAPADPSLPPFPPAARRRPRTIGCRPVILHTRLEDNIIALPAQTTNPAQIVRLHGLALGLDEAEDEPIWPPDDLEINQLEFEHWSQPDPSTTSAPHDGWGAVDEALRRMPNEPIVGNMTLPTPTREAPASAVEGPQFASRNEPVVLTTAQILRIEDQRTRALERKTARAHREQEQGAALRASSAGTTREVGANNGMIPPATAVATVRSEETHAPRTYGPWTKTSESWTCPVVGW